MKKLITLCLSAVAGICIISGCNSAGNKSGEDSAQTISIMEEQPLVSGQYEASEYDIKGENARSGMFDGRVLVALSDEQSAIYVYENGNRTKIDYSIVLERPFEKGDSGKYTTTDKKGNPIVLKADSVSNMLDFDRNGAHISIRFNKEPKSTGTAMEMLERMNEQLNKGKN